MGGGTVSSTGTGNITLTADSMNISTTNAINAATNTVTLQPQTAGTVIDLGGADATGTLGLSNPELGLVTAGTLTIGSAANTGGIQVTAPITSHAGYSTLFLQTGGTITENANTGLQVPDLAAQGAGGVNLNDGTDNAVTIIAGGFTTAGASFTFGGSVSVSAGTVAGVTGITLTGNAGLNLTAPTLTASGTTIINQGSGTFTATVSGPSSIAGAITGVSGSLVKAGTGTLALSGPETFTGTTTVSAGELDVNGSLSSGGGTVTVNSGTTLGGTGTIQRTVTLSGTLSPGVSGPGVLSTSGNVTFQSGSTFAVALTGPTAGTGYSQLVVNGTVSLGNATLQLSTGFSPTPGIVLTLISNQGTQPVSPGFNGNGLVLSLGNGGNQVSIQGTQAGAPTLVVTGNGNDNIVVSSSSSASQGNLSGRSSVLSVDAGASVNQLTFSDASRTTADTYWITSRAIAAAGKPFPFWYQANQMMGGTFSSIRVLGGSGGDTFNVLSQFDNNIVIIFNNFMPAPTTAYGGAGPDLFNVDVNSNSFYSGLTMNGGAGSNTLGVFDMTGGGVLSNTVQSPDNGTVEVNYSGGLNSTSTIDYQGVQQVNVPAS